MIDIDLLIVCRLDSIQGCDPIPIRFYQNSLSIKINWLVLVERFLVEWNASQFCYNFLHGWSIWDVGHNEQEKRHKCFYIVSTCVVSTMSRSIMHMIMSSAECRTVLYVIYFKGIWKKNHFLGPYAILSHSFPLNIYITKFVKYLKHLYFHLCKHKE